jgi:hypothetical protein
MKSKLEMLVPATLLSVILAVGVATCAVAASSPAVTTGTHSHVTDTSAVLHGTINPNGSATAYYFEWGLTTACGVTSVEHSAGHRTSPVSVSATAGELILGTIYHYRLVALHANTVPQPGADATFMTLPLHRPVPQIHSRTRPLRDATKPFVFTTTGSVHGPSWIPAIYDCRGNV